MENMWGSNRGMIGIGLVYQIQRIFQILAGIVDFVHINIRLNEGFDNDFNIVSLAEDMDFSILIRWPWCGDGADPESVDSARASWLVLRMM